MKMTADKTIEIFANEIRALVNRINAIDTNRAKMNLSQPSPIGERDMIAILIMDLLAEYNTEITLIEREPKETFENALELLRTREQRLKVSQGEPSNVNYVQHPSKKGKLPPCNVCGRRNHPTSKCFFKDEKMEKKDSKKRNWKENVAKMDGRQK